MKAEKLIFITGVTGFVGSHLAFELLKSGNRVIGLARDAKEAPAAERALAALAEVGSGDEPFLQNFTAVAGNVKESAAELVSKIRAQTDTPLDQVWHCVATFKFTEHEREEIEATNIEGTEHILELVETVNDGPPPRYFHVSTAYSSGQLYDEYVPEEINHNDSNFRSLYEWSKNKGEKVVEQHQQDHNLDATIFRPSIIVGAKDSKVVSSTAYYQVCEALYRYQNRLQRKLGDDFDGNLNVRLVGDRKKRANFVPIDFVIDAMLLAAAQPEIAKPTLKVFNVVNEEPPSIGLIHEVFCESLGVHGIEMVSEESFEEKPMNTFERVLAKSIAFQSPYMFTQINFSTEKLREYVSFEELPVPQVDKDFLMTINKTFFESLDEARQNGRS